MIAILDKSFFKLRVSVDGLVIRKEVYYESIHRIERYLDVVIEDLAIQSRVFFEFYLDEDIIESW